MTKFSFQNHNQRNNYISHLDVWFVLERWTAHLFELNEFIPYYCSQPHLWS